MPRKCDLAVARRPPGRSGRRGKINALVRTPCLQERVKARERKSGRDTRELDRRAHEGLAQALAILGVVRVAAVALAPQECSKRDAFVDEFRGDDPASADR